MSPQAESVSRPQPWPLHAPLQTRTASGPFVTDSRLYNGYAEYDGELKTYHIFKRPGLATTLAPVSNGAGNGLYTETGSSYIFAVFGSQAYLTVFANNLSSLSVLGSVDGSAPYFFETVPYGSGRVAMMGNGVQAWAQQFSGPPFGRLSFQQITDPNFPASFANGFVNLDGTLYVMDLNGNIFGSSSQNNPYTWSALNVIQANSSADLGVAIAKQLNYLIALKQFSSQVFEDAGNPAPGSPLAAVPDAQIPLGCLAGTSVATIDNSLLWITSNQTISPQIVQMDNLVPTVVSTPAVERILDNVTWATSSQIGIRAWTLKHAGHRFYVLMMSALNVTLVYDLDQKLWYFWTDQNGNYWPIVGTAFSVPSANQAGLHYVQHATNGSIYQLDGDYAFPNDYGNLFPVDIYTPNFTGGTSRRKTLNNLYFDADKVHGSQLQVRYSDDDYRSWSNFRTVSLDREKPRLPKCGTFRFRRAYHLRHMCNTALRIRAMYPQIDLGTS